MRIRAVTLNLLHGAPIPGASQARASVEMRLAWTAEQLAKEQPDVVLLQEASISPRHGNTAETLARLLGMDFVYARANPTRLHRPIDIGRLWGPLAFEEGPAVLSRLPILEHRVHRLSPRLGLLERRIALEALLEGPLGCFSVFSVHLSAGSLAGRLRQVESLVAAVEASASPHPIIVGGDFNAEEHSHEIKKLTELRGWIDSFRHIHDEAAGHTWGQALADTAATAGRRIDFLFSAPSGDEHWEPCNSRLVLDRSFPRSREGVLWASDHYGVLTDFDVPRSLRKRVE
jgi:endonuclease/exonuclease/phosphatase family metal-dependent hydrolase